MPFIKQNGDPAQPDYITTIAFSEDIVERYIEHGYPLSIKFFGNKFPDGLEKHVKVIDNTIFVMFDLENKND